MADPTFHYRLRTRCPAVVVRVLGVVYLLSACYADKGEAGGDAQPETLGGAGSSTVGGTADDGSGGNSTNNSSGSDGGVGGDRLGGFGFGGAAVVGSGGADSEGSGGTSQVAACAEVAAEPLPARAVITSLEGAPDTGSSEEVITITKTSLFREFERLGCGDRGCHGGEDKPLLESPDVFKVTLSSFAQRPNLGTLALERILSSDPERVMPPGSGNGSQLAEDAPLRVLGERLQAWEEHGFPNEFEQVIELDDSGEEQPADPYLLSPELGGKLTNIGSCIPHTSFLSLHSASILEQEMEAKDDLFEAIEASSELPETLVETDLVSMDSAVLARRGVYSYAPTYPLFSDHAGKMRHVRVPLGSSIDYNSQTKDFEIPDNTRFYKTFLKKVVDKNGEVGYRKMETRLIVVRRDERLSDGSYRPRALRAAYAWDRDERMALRVSDPLRNGEPAADRLCSYVVDESATRDPALNPISEQTSEYCAYMTEEELSNPALGQIRHYAIPGTQRCDQCHMGSNNHSYVLGFTPWQVDRRPDGEGGVYEAPTNHELGQLERLIDYGVITGIAPGEAKLEQSQGERLPRSDHELKAQGYMLGNCAFCHNPHGFPVVENQLLAPFDLFPSEDGGIFQFSIERYSPRAKAGQAQNVRFPYITPAFGDHDLGVNRQQVKDLGWGFAEMPVVDFDDDPPDVYVDVSIDGDGNEQQQVYFSFLGPWRSLIWRNVYTPFTYDEDYTIFVHMPRNVAGYDCRAHKIMAEWMLSIPSVDKPQNEREHQPVLEVLPGEAGYDEAFERALVRLGDFNRSVTGFHCPTDDDIIDPKVVLSPLEPHSTNKVRPSPIDEGVLNSPRVAENLPIPLLDAVPDHAHWVSTDTTDPPGAWVPRRSNWQALIAERTATVEDPKLARVIDHLQSVHLSPEQREFSLEPLPMGLWATACQSSSEAADSPTAAALRLQADAPMRRWLEGMFTDETSVPSDVRVHYQSRGEAVFRAICQNCHGREADSRSPLAATILELSGGQTRVANFVDGLFGPTSAPGAFARDEFLVNQGATPADWQARYMLFMGLGGTGASIPGSVLDLVAVSPFYGQAVTAPGHGDPNMLDSAVRLCAQFLGHERVLGEGETAGSATIKLDGVSQTPFSRGAGHYELWESLCSFNNEPVVFAFNVNNFKANFAGVYRAKDAAGNWVYPVNHPVGNQLGHLELGISADNTMPWCMEIRNETELATVVAEFEAWGIEASMIPACPPLLFAEALGQRIHKLAINSLGVDYETPLGNQDFSERWMRHGAMNAGMAAYYYLSGFTSGELSPSQPFDACGEN